MHGGDERIERAEGVCRVRLLGSLEVRATDGREIVRFRGTRAGALFAYLALNPQRAHSRETLAERFWPESDPVVQRTRLRQELAQLRSALDGMHPEMLQISRTEVRPSLDALDTDVSRFEKLLNRARTAPSAREKADLLGEAVTLFRDDLLTEYPSEFTSERLALGHRFEQALQDLARAQKERLDYPAAIATLNRLLVRSGVIEEVHLELMRLYHVLGQPVLVQRQYQTLERALREEQDAEPSDAAKQLLKELRRERQEASASSSPVDASLSDTPPPPPVIETNATTDSDTALDADATLPQSSPPALPDRESEALCVPLPVEAEEPTRTVDAVKSVPLRPRRPPAAIGLILLAGTLTALSLMVSSIVKPGDRADLAARPTAPVLPLLEKGTERWVYFYKPRPGEKTNSDATAIGADRRGNLYVTGLVQTEKEDADILTLKLSPDGKPLWVDRYSSPEHDCDRAFSLVMAESGGCYVAGETYVPGTPDVAAGWRLTLIRYSADGKRLWVHRPPVITKNESYRVKALAAPGGGVYLAGTAQEGRIRKILLLRYDRTGNLLWKRTLAAGKGTETVFSDMVAGETGQVYLCGWTQAADATTGVNTDWLTVCFDARGERKWVDTRDGPAHGADRASRIGMNRFGQVFVGGTIYTGDPSGGGQGTNLAVHAYDQDGALLWKRTEAESGPNVRLTTLTVNQYGGSPLVLTGRKTTSTNDCSALIVTYDAEGNRRWRREQPLPPGYRSSNISLSTVMMTEGEIETAGEVFTQPAGSMEPSGDLLTAHYEANGDLRWHRLFETSEAERPRAWVGTPDNGLAIAGQSAGDLLAHLMVVYYAP